MAFQNLATVLELANQDIWTGPIPLVTHQVKLAVNSLQKGQLVWKMTPNELKKAISADNFAKHVLRDVSESTLAYAIRLARFANN